MPVVLNIQQLAVCPQSGSQAEIAALPEAALVWRNETIEWVGAASDVPQRYANEPRYDAGSRLVVPGLIDCHTHLAFGGWRAHEFRARLEGKTYLEIARQGGGILSTVSMTRKASREQLVSSGRSFLAHMCQLGVTTVECKSGYGLELDTEVRQLEAYQELRELQPVRLVSTFLGAHTFPAEFRGKREMYVQEVCERMLPDIAARGLAGFCDVFVEEGAFSMEEGRTILRRAQQLGLQAKIHADQITNCGGARLAAELQAVSADHLEKTDEAGIEALANAGVVAVGLPLASFYLRVGYMNARSFVDRGVRVALATDFNPGSAPSYHLPLAMLFGCLSLGLLPAEVLKAVTINAACALRLQEETGSLEVGKRADFAVIDSPDVDHWMYHFRPNACVATFIGGRQVWGDLPPFSQT